MRPLSDRKPVSLRAKRLSLLVLAGALFTPTAAVTAAERPNIVLVLADDMGYSDLGCFGSEIHTPNIDALASRGVSFTQFYNQARCCPSRAALLTGLYPHQVGIGAMIDAYAARQREVADSPAYQDHLSAESPTVAEVLRGSGYRTFMVGKWHLGKAPDQWPAHRGFDHSFVQINGAMNYFGSATDGKPEPMAQDDQPFVPPHEGFYSTDAFADHAIDYIHQAAVEPEHEPFFLYLAFNAVHWPLQVPDAERKTYAGVYHDGWQTIRDKRLARMRELGIVPASQTMAPMDRGNAVPWAQLSDEARQNWEDRMEVYASQLEHMDRAVGRVVDALRANGVEQNTLIVFLSDNGGAAEDPNRGRNDAAIGSRDSFRGYARPWATVSNTPWRLHKVTAFEGGISTPMIAAWPAGIPGDKAHSLVREPAHLIDLMPTFLNLAGAPYSGTKPLEGADITAMIKGNPGPADRTFFWEHEGNRAVRKGNYKLVMLSSSPGWELYDESTDRTESHDLAAEKPELCKELAADYEAWAKRCGVVPWSTIKAKLDATH